MADVLSTLLAADRHALEARFWSKVAKSDDGCWLWTGTKVGKGYGYWHLGRGVFNYAHRISWWLATGVWPGSLDTCHHCDTPLCVRPDHLFLGTRADNMADCVRKGRVRADIAKLHEGRNAWHRARTHCKHGHVFDEANTSWRPNGRRACRECNRLKTRKHRARKRAAA